MHIEVDLPDNTRRFAVTADTPGYEREIEGDVSLHGMELELDENGKPSNVRIYINWHLRCTDSVNGDGMTYSGMGFVHLPLLDSVDAAACEMFEEYLNAADGALGDRSTYERDGEFVESELAEAIRSMFT